MPSSDLRYQSGFGNEFATEAVAGALPVGQNAPQQAPLGLYTEQLSGSAFTAPRAAQPAHLDLSHTPQRDPPSVRRSTPPDCCAAGRSTKCPPRPTRCAGTPSPSPKRPPISSTGWSPSRATATRPRRPAWRSTCTPPTVDAGPLLLQCRWRTAARAAAGTRANRDRTGRDRCRAGRDLRHPARHQVPRRTAGRRLARLHLRELRRGPSGCRNWARSAPTGWPIARDFLAPVAAFEDIDAEFRIVAKFLGNLWVAEIDHSPLDVVAWHGNYAPYKYDLARFNCINTVSFDHPDPSIYTVLSSHSVIPGRPTAISPSSRRAGWWRSTPSARRGSTAT